LRRGLPFRRARYRVAAHLTVAAILVACALGISRLPGSPQSAPPVAPSTQQQSSVPVQGVAEDAVLRSRPSTVTIRSQGALAGAGSVSAQTLSGALPDLQKDADEDLPPLLIGPLDSVSSAVEDAVDLREDLGEAAGGVVALGDVIDPKQPYFVLTVAPGETPSGIAGRFGISLETFTDNNPETEGGTVLIAGKDVVVPRADGMLHIVNVGDTLEKIAASYEGGSVQAIIDYEPNQVASDADLAPGNRVLVVGARPLPPPPPPPPPPPAPDPSDPGDGSAPPANGNGWGWPAFGPITTYFGQCLVAGSCPHRGIDIGLAAYVAQGTHAEILAGARGTVIRVEWTTYGYGYHVIVDHGLGVTSLYGHMSDIWVTPGQQVSQGQALGLSGNTGYSTGEHLHFEIMVNGGVVDPLIYLP
jgi:murein DD-endopeptidase MepM/ murein hydrolase activator NlpD